MFWEFIFLPKKKKKKLLILSFSVNINNQELHLSKISHQPAGEKKKKNNFSVSLFETPQKVCEPTTSPTSATTHNLNFFSLPHHHPNMSPSQVYYAVSRRPKLQLHGEQSGAH